jgi:hypothetical protein
VTYWRRSGLAGTVKINPRPQETPWTTPLDEDDEHATYDPAQVTAYFAAATRAALVLSALRTADARHRSTRGGPAIEATRGQPSSPTPTPRQRDSRPRRCHRRPPTGTPGSANACSTGTMPAPARIHTAPRSISPSRQSGMRARSAAGIPRCLPVCNGLPRRSPDRPQPGAVAPSSRRTALPSPASSTGRCAWELNKKGRRLDQHPALLFAPLLDWAGDQVRELGQPDAQDLAVTFLYGRGSGTARIAGPPRQVRAPAATKYPA